MSGLEQIAIGVMGVVLYASGAGVTYRLIRPRCYGRYADIDAGFISGFWLVTMPCWGFYRIVFLVLGRPLFSVFRVCAGTHEEKNEASKR